MYSISQRQCSTCKNYLLFFSILYILFYQSTSAMAMYQMITGAKAIALAGAVTANPPSLMAVHYNPAGLVQAREGLVYYQGLSTTSFNRQNHFSPDQSFNVLNISHASDDPITNRSSMQGKSYLYYPIYGDSHGDTINFPLPLGATYRRSDSRWIMASGSYMPFAWGNCYDSNDPSKYQAYEYYQQHLIYASPGIAYQWNDFFSFGLSMGIGQTALARSSIVRFPNDTMARIQSLPIPGKPGLFDGLANMRLNLRDDIAMSLNAGILWKPFHNLQFGCVYRSPVDSHPKGNIHIQYTDKLLKLTQWYRKNPIYANSLKTPGLGEINQPFETGTAYLKKYQWPDSIQMGIQYQPSSCIKLMFDFQWIRWSAQNEYRLVFEKPDNQLIHLLQAMGQSSVEGQTIIYEQKASDTLSYHFGLEWQFRESLFIRGGLSFQPQSTKDSHINLLSLPDTTYISSGIEWRWPNRWIIEQGFGYYISDNKTIPNNTSQRLNLIDSNNVFFSPYAGQNISTKIFGFVFSLNVRIPLSQINYTY